MAGLMLLFFAGFIALGYLLDAKNRECNTLRQEAARLQQAHQEAVNKIDVLTDRLHCFAGRMNKDHQDMCDFFHKLHRVIRKLPRYKIPDREQCARVNRIRNNVLMFVETVRNEADPDDNCRELYTDILKEIDQLHGWLAQQSSRYTWLRHQ